jgi:hypothetical protein
MRLTSDQEWYRFKDWYEISGSIYFDSINPAWHAWQTVIAFLDKDKADEKLEDKESKDQ